MKCASCELEARGPMKLGERYYPLCSLCARNVEKSAELVVKGLKSMFRNQKHVGRLWERA